MWLDDFTLSDEAWASFGIPIGLAFFIDSSATGGVVALYPSPAGATESELEIEAWRDLRGKNPVLMGLEPDAEALIVNRIADPPRHAIAPIDECYRLVGLIKLDWDGISGGAGVERAIEGFFAELEERASDEPSRPTATAGRPRPSRCRSPERRIPTSSSSRRARCSTPRRRRSASGSGSATDPGGACSRSRSPP